MNRKTLNNQSTVLAYVADLQPFSREVIAAIYRKFVRNKPLLKHTLTEDVPETRPSTFEIGVLYADSGLEMALDDKLQVPKAE